MKLPKQPDRPALPPDRGDPSLAELKARRRAQKECTQRIEALKTRIFRITERHMEQAVRLVRRWISNDDK
jgi:flagellar biosynthesis/type III secretory pathway M-ring protein FliF/YscJ